MSRLSQSVILSAPTARAPGRLALWWDAERGRAVLWLPVLLGLGVLLYFDLPAEPPTALGAVLAVALVAMAAGLRASPALPLFAALAAVALGFAAAQLRTALAPPVTPLPPRAAIVEGRVGAVDLLPSGRRIELRDPSIAGEPPLPRSLRIRLRDGDTTALEAGARIRLRALLRSPAPPAFPGGWDFQRDAFFAGQAGTGTALGPVEVLPEPGGAPPFRRMRDAINARLVERLPGPDGAIAAGLLTGATSAIPAEELAAFRDSGLFHLLSVSGLHMAIVVGLVMGVVRLLLAATGAALVWPAKPIAAVAALAAGLFYLLLTGSQVPTLRSFLMAALVLVAILAQRRAITLRGLALAAALVLLTAPEALLGPSFQMSFAAVLALVAGWEAVRPRLAAWRGEGRALRRLALPVLGLALTSLLAGLATTPFAVFHFGRLQIWGLVANMAAVPLTSLWVMPAGVAALLLMPFGLDAPAIAVMGWGVGATRWIAAEVASWPAAAPAVPKPPLWGIGALTLGMLWLSLWRSRARLIGVVGLTAGLASPWLARPPDLLVSPDARLIAWHDGAAMWLARRPGGAEFQVQQWIRLWAADPPIPLSERDCAPQGCRIAAGRVLFLPAPRRDPPCDVALIVSHEPIRDRCRGVPFIDRFSVWRDGAHAVWLEPGSVRILSDRAYRGDRPWVPPVPLPRPRLQPGTTLAPVETLPPPDEGQ